MRRPHFTCDGPESPISNLPALPSVVAVPLFLAQQLLKGWHYTQKNTTSIEAYIPADSIVPP